MNNLVMAGFAGDRAVRIDNQTLLDMGPTGVIRIELAHREALIAAIAERFAMPRDIATVAISTLPALAQVGSAGSGRAKR